MNDGHVELLKHLISDEVLVADDRNNEKNAIKRNPKRPSLRKLSRAIRLVI